MPRKARPSSIDTTSNKENIDMYPENMEEAKDLVWFVQKIDQEKSDPITKEMMLKMLLDLKRSSRETAQDNNDCSADNTGRGQGKTYPCPCREPGTPCMAGLHIPTLNEPLRSSYSTQKAGQSSECADGMTGSVTASPSHSALSCCPLYLCWRFPHCGCNVHNTGEIHNTPPDLLGRARICPCQACSRSAFDFCPHRTGTASQPYSRTSRVCFWDSQLSSCPNHTPWVRNPQPSIDTDKQGGQP